MFCLDFKLKAEGKLSLLCFKFCLIETIRKVFECIRILAESPVQNEDFIELSG